MTRDARPAGIGRRVLLKLSGEMLGGRSGRGFDERGLVTIASQVAGAVSAGAQTAVVLGGGNFLRGAARDELTLPRTTADAIGMLGTLANALALRDALARQGVAARVLAAFEVARFAELFRADRASDALERGEVVLCAGGTGNAFFTTDTAAALRALELGCSVLVKGTKVDGVYSADPILHPRARRFSRLGFKEVLRRRLRVMDLTAITLCMENRLPVVVLDATRAGTVRAFLGGADVGTLILPDGPASRRP